MMNNSKKRICPQCGSRHDFDYSRCPVCGFEYLKKI